MSYFKRLTESNRNNFPDTRQFTPTYSSQDDFCQDIDQLPGTYQINRPYKSFKMHKHQPMFKHSRKSKCNLQPNGSSFRERMRRLEEMVEVRGEENRDRRGGVVEEEKREQKRDVDRRMEMIESREIVPVHHKKVSFSQNTSPIKQNMQDSVMGASIKMSEQLLNQFVKVIEKLTQQRSRQQSRQYFYPPPPAQYYGYPDPNNPHQQSTPNNHYRPSMPQSPPYPHYQYPYAHPYPHAPPAPHHNTSTKQPPIIINNIIKPQDHNQSKFQRYNMHYSKDEDSYRRDAIDDRLEFQEMMIRKLESQRRSQFNNTMNLRGVIGETSKKQSPVRRDHRSKNANSQKNSENTYEREEEYEDCHRNSTQIMQQLNLLNTQQHPTTTTTIPNNPNPNQRQKSQQILPIPPTAPRKRQFSSQRPSPSNPTPNPQPLPSRQVSEATTDITTKPAVFFELPVNSNCNPKVSLAEAFQMRRGGGQMPKDSKRDASKSREKSKQELAQIRKQMMKRRPQQLPAASQQLPTASNQNSLNQIFSQKHSVAARDHSNASSCKRQPSRQLMERLINGVKHKIDEKEMKALTSKNYQELPEVRQKREEMRKKEEFSRRMQMKKEFQQTLRVRK